ncbi:type-4 uracil-DNA glycosylase [Sulfurisphaera tokodaii]|uniref:Type-4 uracil-DNA glycosylase n=3 Tax=Sulfurisphaera tokodaii TaxID=111955 RepID=UDGA_SULTO|nr:type-4 uracil-DNA glycosylase [Sulfurisphaera tokodaii]Q96YD0.1 RecName: Full=Type-4 uracil-DNA glycosylase; AltName: Full=stoUDG [Sulfurisphaera tokodaii str. 7]BAB67347.1 uracil-DNA glycosylase [Sulfurisphaera tokodaii str. 7]HII73157.1 uracil-DNA glycosylase [Sulfurisphaera tokodaii]
MDSLEKIKEEVISCKKCKLWQFRTNAVPGEGYPKAEIMFVGEAPGENEDKEGRPFVGAAGKLLTQMIKEILGLERDQVFITNVVKCRPPNNRDPEEDEITACSPYLDRQIDIIMPKIIVTLGRHSTKYIFSKMGENFSSITKVRGKSYVWKYKEKEIIVFPTYHPAAALYNPNLRKILEEDFKKIRELAITPKRYTIDYFLGGKNRSWDKREKSDSNSGK